MFKISNKVAALLVYFSILIYPFFSEAVKEANLDDVILIDFNSQKNDKNETMTVKADAKGTKLEKIKYAGSKYNPLLNYQPLGIKIKLGPTSSESKKVFSANQNKLLRSNISKINHHGRELNELEKILLTLNENGNYASSKNHSLDEVNPDLLYASYKPIFDLGGKNLKSVFCGLQDILSSGSKESIHACEDKDSDILENIQENFEELKKASKHIFPEMVTKGSIRSMDVSLDLLQNATQIPQLPRAANFERSESGTTNRYSYSNGTVKVLIGKWNLESDIPNQKEYFKKFEVISRTSIPDNEKKVTENPPSTTHSMISETIPLLFYKEKTAKPSTSTMNMLSKSIPVDNVTYASRIITDQTTKPAMTKPASVANKATSPHLYRTADFIKTNLNKNQKLNEFDTTFVPGIHFWGKTTKGPGSLISQMYKHDQKVNLQGATPSFDSTEKKYLSYIQKSNTMPLQIFEGPKHPMSFEMTMPMLALLPPMSTTEDSSITLRSQVTQFPKPLSDLTTSISNIKKSGAYTSNVFSRTILKPVQCPTTEIIREFKDSSPLTLLFDEIKLIDNITKTARLNQESNNSSETPSLNSQSSPPIYLGMVTSSKTSVTEETFFSTSSTTPALDILPDIQQETTSTDLPQEVLTTTELPKILYPQKPSVPERQLPDIQDDTGTSGMYGLQPYNPSMTVREYVSLISDKAAIINNRNMIAQWNHETNMTHRNYKIAMVSTLALIHYQRIQNQYLDTLKDVQICDPMLEREIKLLYLPGMCILPDIKVAVFEELLFAMDTIFSSASVTAWHNPHIRFHLPDIKRIMLNSNIPEEMSYYWTEWRNATGRKLRRLYEQYVELMNLTALSNGFCDASEMWTRDYETEDFMQLMGCHWEDIRPLYLELHAFVRYKLHKHYGDVTMTDDYSLPIPAHLVGDLWGQTWKSLFNISRPYDRVFDHPTMDIKSKGYTTTKMALYAEAFFSSLGFPPLPETFWKKSILTKQNVDMSCEPTAWDMCDGKDFRIKMCSNGTLKDFLDLHHELTHVEYFIQYHDLSFPFRAGPHPGFHEALAGTILLSVDNPTHLGQVGLSPKWKKQEVDIDINYLLRVALDKVAFLPYSYIVDLWRYKVFKGDIKANDYNKRWWELRLQYQGLAPPSQRSEEDFDPGCKFHIPGNKPYIQNFLSTILQFQFHEALCRQAGLVGPKNALHHCDISNNQKAGTILRRVMSMGATQHWRVAMNELTGTRQISSKGLVEFFKPLLAWLRKENMRNGQKIGWKNTIAI